MEKKITTIVCVCWLIAICVSGEEVRAVSRRCCSYIVKSGLQQRCGVVLMVLDDSVVLCRIYDWIEPNVLVLAEDIVPLAKIVIIIECNKLFVHFVSIIFVSYFIDNG